jgi:glycosyltransferase involved in cell wall biosynthesis
MAKRRVVLAMIEPPLPFGNAAGRGFYVLLRGLVERGHEVVALATCSKPEEIDRCRALFPAPRYDLRLFPEHRRGGLAGKLATFRRPYSYMFSPEFVASLRAELARGYDVLHLEQLWAGWLAEGHEDRALVSVHFLPSIDLSERPDASRGQRRERRLMARAEGTLLRRLRHFRACTPRLVEPILAANPRADVHVLPFGIDLELYPFIEASRRAEPATQSLNGSMNWYPSYSAGVRLLTRLWPEIRRRVPEARLRIVGWSARSALAAHLDTPGVEVLEDVPETRPYFEQTSVMLYAPARGSGMKIKVMEAMAFGVPVVTTSEGIEGLPAEDGVHAGVAEDDAGLIDRAVALLRDRDLQESRRRAARAMLERCCSPGPTLDGIEAIYESMLGRRGAGRAAGVQ